MSFPFPLTVKDLLALLEKLPSWKDIAAAPGRIDALEQRIAELETKLARRPGETCPSCGELEFRVEKSVPAGSFKEQAEGRRDRHMHCAACGFRDVVIHR
jgi:hypothetical protein